MSPKLSSIAKPPEIPPEEELNFVIEPIQSVQVDALVALKIEKHAKENFPASTTGALFGLDKDGVLQVSNCFRFLNNFNVDEDGHAHDRYQMEIMQHLRMVNVDSHTVGWYQASTSSNFINLHWLNHQMDFQSSIPNSVVLEFDPQLALSGQFSLRAFRLTETFHQVLKSRVGARLFSEAVTSAKLLDAGLLAELPVVVRAAPLVAAWMYQDGRRQLSLPTPSLERPLVGLMDALDLFSHEQSRYATWQRTYLREKTRLETLLKYKRVDTIKLPVEPNKLDPLLLSQQVLQQSAQVARSFVPAALSTELIKETATLFAGTPNKHKKGEADVGVYYNSEEEVEDAERTR